MGNLPGGVNRFTLANLFNKQWEILEARFIYDRDTSRSRGFGFVTCASDEGVEDLSPNLDGAVSSQSHLSLVVCL